MIRRIITSRDVEQHPADGGELRVGGDDVVTPSALEAASRRNVRIVRADGSEAAPAARGAGPTPADLPGAALPPPPDAREGDVIVSVFGRNRPYVLAEITSAIAAARGNILDITQRIIRDYFSLVLFVDTSELSADFGTLKRDLEALSREGDYRVSVEHEAVFRAMHRV